MNNQGIYYFHQGTSCKAYELLGCHFYDKYTVFRVFAPHALKVSVVGDFNNWDKESNYCHKISQEGIWECTIEGVKEFSCYQFAIFTNKFEWILKSDPFAFHSELRPAKASRVYNLNGYQFNDNKWINNRGKKQNYSAPLNIYEVHLGSWRRYEDGNCFSYVKLAEELSEYVHKMGYTHVELLPISEYPYDPSWGYQVTGFYSITSRYGAPKDFMQFVDIMHQKGIGVIIDWVPGHFNKDDNGLIEFDGEFLYEPANSKKRENSGWGTRCFDYGRTEVQSFLVSNAIFFCEKYHIDGLRVDAVASMLYLDFGREKGQYELNSYGTNINLDALAFIKKVNQAVKTYDDSIMLIAEESTTFPKITEPVANGGLGFDYKWNMGWMNDTLKYISLDPIYRQYHHNLITFQLTYIFSEHYILALSHDEVVHLKKSLIQKIPGEYNQKFAGLKSYLTYLITHPGKKLIFMGGEFGQFNEWCELKELDWSCLAYNYHQGLQKYDRDLNKIYKKYKSLYDDTQAWNSFKWVVVDDNTHNVFSYMRIHDLEKLLVIINFAYVEWNNYELKIENGSYEVLINSEDEVYGGSKKYKGRILQVVDGSLRIDLPYSSGMILRKVG